MKLNQLQAFLYFLVMKFFWGEVITLKNIAYWVGYIFDIKWFLI